jgi:hypothetical protein
MGDEPHGGTGECDHGRPVEGGTSPAMQPVDDEGQVQTTPSSIVQMTLSNTVHGASTSAGDVVQEGVVAGRAAMPGAIQSEEPDELDPDEEVVEEEAAAGLVLLSLELSEPFALAFDLAFDPVPDRLSVL